MIDSEVADIFNLQSLRSQFAHGSGPPSPGRLVYVVR